MTWRIAGKSRAIIVLAGCAAVLSGCLTSAPVSAPAQGAATQETAVPSAIVAALKGGLIGGAVGEDLGSAERRRALEAEYRALEYTPAGQSVIWGRADGRGGSGVVVAAQPYSVGSQNCRQYVQTVTVRNRTASARGTACRNPDGSWTLLT